MLSQGWPKPIAITIIIEEFGRSHSGPPIFLEEFAPCHRGPHIFLEEFVPPTHMRPRILSHTRATARIDLKWKTWPHQRPPPVPSVRNGREKVVQREPKASQREPQRRPKGPQRWPKGAQESPKEPKRDQGGGSRGAKNENCVFSKSMKIRWFLP